MSAKIVIEGEYVTSVNGKREVRSYEETLQVDEVETALSDILKFQILADRLRSKDKRFIRIRTHNLVSCDSSEKTRELAAMGWEQLEDDVKRRRLPIIRSDFDSITIYREAIQMAESAPERFVKWYEDYKATRKKRQRLLSLNRNSADGKNTESQTMEIDGL